MMYWADHTMQFIKITSTTTSSPNRTEDGQSTLSIDIISDTLKFQYLRIVMNFNGEWIFLSEAQFCGKHVANRYIVV